jgi:hypothetical protein
MLPLYVTLYLYVGCASWSLLVFERTLEAPRSDMVKAIFAALCLCLEGSTDWHSMEPLFVVSICISAAAAFRSVYPYHRP